MDNKGKFFTMRVVKLWNRLPRKAVHALFDAFLSSVKAAFLTANLKLSSEQKLSRKGCDPCFIELSRCCTRTSVNF